MYTLIVVFFTATYSAQHGFSTARAAASLGEYSSLAACQAAASATMNESKRLKEEATNTMSFVCARK
jgi:hypothetical protein